MDILRPLERTFCWSTARRMRRFTSATSSNRSLFVQTHHKGFYWVRLNLFVVAQNVWWDFLRRNKAGKYLHREDRRPPDAVLHPTGLNFPFQGSRSLGMQPKGQTRIPCVNQSWDPSLVFVFWVSNVIINFKLAGCHGFFCSSLISLSAGCQSIHVTDFELDFLFLFFWLLIPLHAPTFSGCRRKALWERLHFHTFDILAGSDQGETQCADWPTSMLIN